MNNSKQGSLSIRIKTVPGCNFIPKTNLWREVTFLAWSDSVGNAIRVSFQLPSGSFNFGMSNIERHMDTCEANSIPILQKVRDKMVDRTMWQQGTCLHGNLKVFRLNCGFFNRADSFEKTLVLGKIEGRRWSRQQRMRWLDSIIDKMDMIVSHLREMVKDRGAWHAAVHSIAKSQTWLSGWTI